MSSDSSAVKEEIFNVIDEQFQDIIKNEKLIIGSIIDETIVSRKQSASDLQSRLKTRKLLGVGELAGDNGDIYKSKISQLLGINESLYVRLPRGMFIWNTINSLYFLVLGSTCMFLPRLGFFIDHGIDALSNDSVIIARYYGVALISIGIMFRFILQQRETRADIALLLLVTAVFHGSILIVSTATNGTVKWWSAVFRSVFVLGNIFYHTLVDGQGGLHRQLVRVVEDLSLFSSSPVIEKKTNVGSVEELNKEDKLGKKTD